MNRDLLTQKLVERALHEGAANNLGRAGKQLVELLDMVAPGDAEELKHGLVILQGQDSLVACRGSVNPARIPGVVSSGSYYRET